LLPGRPLGARASALIIDADAVLYGETGGRAPPGGAQAPRLDSESMLHLLLLIRAAAPEVPRGPTAAHPREFRRPVAMHTRDRCVDQRYVARWFSLARRVRARRRGS